MVSLLDLAAQPETIQLGGGELEVHGVNARGVAMLLQRFPDLQRVMMGREVDAKRLMDLGPDAIAAIIAAGVGRPGDTEAEAAVERLSLETQLDIITAVIRLTMPSGLGPFVQRLAAVLNVEAGTVLAKGLATTSRPQ